MIDWGVLVPVLIGNAITLIGSLLANYFQYRSEQLKLRKERVNYHRQRWWLLGSVHAASNVRPNVDFTRFQYLDSSDSAYPHHTEMTQPVRPSTCTTTRGGGLRRLVKGIYF